jgi:hypothetical protein
VTTEYICEIVQVGTTVLQSPQGDAQTTLPIVLICLTDIGGSFTNGWFFASAVAKTEMLATALAAVSTSTQVNIFADKYQPGASPTGLQIYSMYLIA